MYVCSFPADFIAEGIDQTRGWFYTLLVLSTALYGQPPFKNLICNGLILARYVPMVTTSVLVITGLNSVILNCLAIYDNKCLRCVFNLPLYESSK